MADLRNLFLQSAEITERAERYHRERIPLMKAGDVQPDLAQERHGIAMHVIPADAFSSSVIVDPKRALELFENFKPIGASGYSWRFTFDGFLVYRAAGERGGSFGYTLVGRSGLVEAIKVRISNGDQIPIAAVELQLIQAVQQYAAAMFAAGVLPPLYAYITLYGVGGQRLIFRGQSPFADEQEPITRQDLHLPAAVIEEATTEAVAAALKPAFDAIWNAGGYEGSLSYKGGAWAQNGAEL